LACELALLPKPPRIETMLTMFERLEMQRRQAAGQRVNRFMQ